MPVFSPLAFTRPGGAVWVCPITQGGQGRREQGFTVPPMACGTKTQGAVPCHPPHTVGFRRPRATFLEEAPADAVDAVPARVRVVPDRTVPCGCRYS